MPKLIIKQNVIKRSWLSRNAGWLFVVACLSLLSVGMGALLVSSHPALSKYWPGKPLMTASLDTPSTYRVFQNVLWELKKEYEHIAANGPENYEVNLNLMGKAEAILTHLNKMRAHMERLPVLEQTDWQAQQSEYTYQIDYWRSQLHFRRLRLSRFGNGELPIARDYPVYNGGDEFLAVKPEGILPLPDVGNMHLLPEMEPLPLEPADGLSQVAVHTQETLQGDVVMPLGVAGANATERDETPKKRRFQFATPPPGMKLPDDFCDLTDPGATCKP